MYYSIIKQPKNAIDKQVGTLKYGSRVYIDDTQRTEEDAFTWGKISDGEFTGDWIALGKADASEKFVSRNPPG